jgi:hypothetical protein
MFLRISEHFTLSKKEKEGSLLTPNQRQAPTRNDSAACTTQQEKSTPSGNSVSCFSATALYNHCNRYVASSARKMLQGWNWDKKQEVSTLNIMGRHLEAARLFSLACAIPLWDEKPNLEVRLQSIHLQLLEESP